MDGNLAQSVHKLNNLVEKCYFFALWGSRLFTKLTRNFPAVKLLVQQVGKKFTWKNVSSLTKLAENTISLKLGLEPMFSSSYQESALSKVASTTPDIMFRLCILVISCASFIKPSINPIFDFLPLFAGFLLLLPLRVTYIKQSKTRLVLNSNK